MHINTYDKSTYKECVGCNYERVGMNNKLPCLGLLRHLESFSVGDFWGVKDIIT